MIVPTLQRGNASQDAPRPLLNVAQMRAQAPALSTSCARLTESAICAICDAERHGRHTHAERWARSVPGDDRSHALRGNAAQDAPRPLLNAAQMCAQAPALSTSCARLTESAVCAICDAERHGMHTHVMGTISVGADLMIVPTPSFPPENRPNPAAFRVRHTSPEVTGVLSGARDFDDHGLFAVWAVGRGGFCFGFWRCRSGLPLARPCLRVDSLFAEVQWRSLHNRLVPFHIARVRLTATDNRRYGLAQPAYRANESLQGRLSLARHGSLQYTSNRFKGGMVQRTRLPSKARQTAHRLKTSPCRTI